MSAAEIVARDIWVRHTAGDGRSHVVVHRVWDADRFIATQQEAAAKVNADEKDPAKRKAKVEQITQAQYEAERERRR